MEYKRSTSSMTPDQSGKVGVGMVANPVPFLTPRPERRRPDSRGVDWGSSKAEKDRGEVNIQVLLRCRPLTDEEQKCNVPKVITCNEHKREVSILQNVANKQVDKIFTFDKVFGPKAQQRSVYDQAIYPIVNEVLEGFNCTVFAYGQTGTGKTYTMEGGMRNKGGELPAEAGVIPRAVRQIFDTLEAQNADYSMKVTFLELYNEEIVDLLTTEDCTRPSEDRQKKPISLMEDGKGCVFVRGLEEEAVYSANDIYNLLERGAAKRRTADTLLNKRSSRSHSVFTITVHVKQATVGSEDLVKYGKLNLVDLAGSENISRSGARDGRAREAGEINKSLLTLGRVINSLVEHSGHVPYRDSKLTRLLRDSLGGKTKTCIIATVSPSAHCLEETLSTLDYAHRAKNIKNKPEANQKMSKAMLLKDMYLEIEKMKQDLRAAREKNGVYISHERYAQEEAEKKLKNEKIEQLEADLNLNEKEVNRYRELYESEQERSSSLERDLNHCKENLEKSNKALLDIQGKHKEAMLMLKKKDFFISKLLDSENCLVEHAKGLRNKLHDASEDVTKLSSKIDYKSKLEAENNGLLTSFSYQLDHSLKDLQKVFVSSVSQQQQQMRSMEEHVSLFLDSKHDNAQILESRINKITDTYTSGMTALKKLVDTLQMEASSDLLNMKSKVSNQIMAVENIIQNAVMEAKNATCDIQNSISDQKQMLALSAQQHEEGLHKSLVSAHEISTATINFFNSLSQQATKLMAALEQNHKTRSLELAAFERNFKEDAAREQQLAIENISEILRNLTLKQTSMVTNASRKVDESSSQDNEKLLKDLSDMVQITNDGKREVNEYMETSKIHYTEDTFISTENRAVMENCLEECTNKIGKSLQHWDNTKLVIDQLNESSMVDTESFISETIRVNKLRSDDIAATHMSMDALFKSEASDLKSSVNDSLKRDQEMKKEFDSRSKIFLDHLTCLKDKHGDTTENMLNKTESLKKDYQVDHDSTPTKHEIDVPSLTSIEALRTPSFTDLLATTNIVCENRQTYVENGSKFKYHHQQITSGSPNRSPFADVN
ncbi:putative plus-end-directed kinesin ATPase [Helianthus annuus]|uniref:Plus-end-directed kinesin ATPase n=1 Tax=Helianthus annuus TaxID=4232 RepID=A0A251VS27_HELAN|nr:kinesin-like protein KIN-5B [Helianthus annuus]XP_021984831.1 kinesin-like protein KIN-5B [Helianthus annuus]KAF5823551.1 putative plus-end-directed kinesin ATPase [Helianthus annuus]KAJ0612878.1 putative plus-end-directed kinesin ATPase [Helianthus annuus]KAJ0624509.1 putative plus-end-directed kinesin ATPase [Helianthus annuus]KAJ0628265.1 putative plus-end-directed kinesin ATPase [Helianthus annuus]KAJ0784551.1 putative plus-end-directed kinesin ATPase [Helianthus annuus]